MNTRLFQAFYERVQSMSKVSVRDFRAIPIAIYYALQGHPLHQDSYRRFDFMVADSTYRALNFTVAVGASTLL